MLPWIYGFTWQTGNVIFLSIFYCVVAVIFGSFGIAVIRAYRDLTSGRLNEIRWHVDFDDLPEFAKTCRHVFSGEIEYQVCRNGFDCRSCKTHSGIIGVHMGANASYTGNESPSGLTIQSDCMYHRGHTWVHRESDRTLTIGLDPLAERLLWSRGKAELPEVGSRLHVNGAGWYFRNGGSRVRVLSPVDGEVVAVGGRDEGFYLKVNPGDDSDLRHLLKGTEVYPWMTREIERLEILLGADGDGINLADGGVLLDDVAASYPELNWENILAQMLLES